LSFIYCNASLPPLLTVWPDLKEVGTIAPQTWDEKAPAADVIMVLEKDAARTKRLTDPAKALNVHIVKNRSGETVLYSSTSTPRLQGLPKFYKRESSERGEEGVKP
jgi:hypothetical protein